ncbi:MAG: ribosome maturation factor RimM [Rhodospirillales bacterium]
MGDDARRPGDGRICLGVIAGARGLRGDVWIRTFTADPADVAAYGSPTDRDGRRYKLRIVERRDDRVLARIDGVGDRTAAEALKGISLYVERAALPEPDEDEFYHADLIGCVAVVGQGDPDQGHSGPDGKSEPEVRARVSAVYDFGGGPVLEIDWPTGSSLLVPFSRTCVPDIDLVRRLIRVVLPPGLLGDTSAGVREDAEKVADEG